MLAFIATDSTIQGMKTITVDVLYERIEANSDAVAIVDVRTKQEFDAEHIRGALHIPQTELENETVLRELPKERTIYLICRSGSRSRSAQSFLYQNGITDTYNVIGGMLMWKAMHFPTVTR
jgi:rhodanese-related sulfurtransferase